MSVIPLQEKWSHAQRQAKSSMQKDCGWQFVDCFAPYLISEETRVLIEQNKAHKQWMWLAMDTKSRQIIAFHVGDRSRKSAKRLWVKIPRTYRQHATFYTDQYVVYEGVIPATQHQAISKLARNQSHRAVQQHLAPACFPSGA